MFTSYFYYFLLFVSILLEFTNVRVVSFYITLDYYFYVITNKVILNFYNNKLDYCIIIFFIFFIFSLELCSNYFLHRASLTLVGVIVNLILLLFTLVGFMVFTYLKYPVSILKIFISFFVILIQGLFVSYIWLFWINLLGPGSMDVINNLNFPLVSLQEIENSLSRMNYCYNNYNPRSYFKLSEVLPLKDSLTVLSVVLVVKALLDWLFTPLPPLPHDLVSPEDYYEELLFRTMIPTYSCPTLFLDLPNKSHLAIGYPSATSIEWNHLCATVTSASRTITYSPHSYYQGYPVLSMYLPEVLPYQDPANGCPVLIGEISRLKTMTWLSATFSISWEFKTPQEYFLFYKDRVQFFPQLLLAKETSYYHNYLFMASPRAQLLKIALWSSFYSGTVYETFYPYISLLSLSSYEAKMAFIKSFTSLEIRILGHYIADLRPYHLIANNCSALVSIDKLINHYLEPDATRLTPTMVALSLYARYPLILPCECMHETIYDILISKSVLTEPEAYFLSRTIPSSLNTSQLIIDYPTSPYSGLATRSPLYGSCKFP